MGLCVPVDAIMAILPDLNTREQQSINRHWRYLQASVDPDIPYSAALGDWLVNHGSKYFSGNGLKHCVGCGYVERGDEKIFYAGETIPGMSTLINYGFEITGGFCKESLKLYRMAKEKAEKDEKPWEPIFKEMILETSPGQGGVALGTA
jgi:hypothetical protein